MQRTAVDMSSESIGLDVMIAGRTPQAYFSEAEQRSFL